LIVKTGVVGVSGYTGQRLVELLKGHPVMDLCYLFSTSFSGHYTDVNPSAYACSYPLVGPFSVEQCAELDVVFLAVPHTKAMPLVSKLHQQCPTLKIIDLSADFRLKDADTYESYYKEPHTAYSSLSASVYGLPEVYKDTIKAATLLANPGCYATAMILGLWPLKGRLSSNTPVVIDAKSGVSGAGKGLKQSSLFCEVHDSLSAYATGEHRHMAELVQETGFSNVMFSPHLVPMHAGIEAAIYIQDVAITQAQLTALFNEAYADAPFVHVLDPSTEPNTRLVTHTNNCVIIPKKKGDWVVIFSLIDNLVKGASGQAIQNANIMFGLDESTGLT
jgi:N-acetyl-gamma-glutamyl-phosphate reductase